MDRKVEPDFKEYVDQYNSLSKLKEIRDRINKDLYPENFDYIKQKIIELEMEKLSKQSNDDAPPMLPPKNVKRVNGCLIAFIILGGLFLIWMSMILVSKNFSKNAPIFTEIEIAESSDVKILELYELSYNNSLDKDLRVKYHCSSPFKKSVRKLEEDKVFKWLVTNYDIDKYNNINAIAFYHNQPKNRRSTFNWIYTPDKIRERLKTINNDK